MIPRSKTRDCRQETGRYSDDFIFSKLLAPRLLSPVSCKNLGFTLIELLIAMSILSVGIVGAMQVFPVGLKASQRSKMKSRAALVAQRSIEFLKLKSWDDLVEGESSETIDEFEVTSRIRLLSFESFIDSSRMKAFEVEVGWTENDRARRLVFVTYAVRGEASSP